MAELTKFDICPNETSKKDEGNHPPIFFQKLINRISKFPSKYAVNAINKK
ncbi:hypothetical protein GCM10022297_13320 [Lactobacillus hamsteri]